LIVHSEVDKSAADECDETPVDNGNDLTDDHPRKGIGTLTSSAEEVLYGKNFFSLPS